MTRREQFERFQSSVDESLGWTNRQILEQFLLREASQAEQREMNERARDDFRAEEQEECAVLVPRPGCYWRSCDYCGRTYRALRPHGRFCSNSHRTLWNLRKEPSAA